MMATHMSGSDFFELPSTYGSSPDVQADRHHTRRSLRALGGLQPKSASSSYNPILAPQEEYNRGGLSTPEATWPSSTPLGPGRIGKFGTELLVEIVLCSLALLASVPFIWLAVTVAKFDHREISESDSEYIKQSTTTVCPTLDLVKRRR